MFVWIISVLISICNFNLDSHGSSFSLDQYYSMLFIIIIIIIIIILSHSCWLLLAFVLCLSIISIVHYTNWKIVLKSFTNI